MKNVGAILIAHTSKKGKIKMKKAVQIISIIAILAVTLITLTGCMNINYEVKLKDGDETFYKKFNAKDVTLIKSPENEEEDPEEKEHLKELQELEKLEKMDTQNKTDDDI